MIPAPLPAQSPAELSAAACFRMAAIGVRRYARFPEERKAASRLMALNAMRLFAAEVGKDEAMAFIAKAFWP